MFCTKCGVQLEDKDRFCYQCGTITARASSPALSQPLMRSTMNKRIAGVCGGLAEYNNVDPTLVRLLWIVLTLGLPPAGIFGYIIAWIIMPKRPLVVYAYPPAPMTPATQQS